MDVFHSFILTYQQLAAIKMQKIRDSIIQTRRYIDGLGDVFIDVQQSHQQAIAQMTKQEQTGQVTRVTFSAIKKNGKKAAVFISPDTKFSGRITKEVFESFRRHLDSGEKLDPIIVGSVGERMFQAAFPDRPHQVFHIPQSLSQVDDLRDMIEQVIQYEVVDVFYSRFYSLIKQGAVSSNITGNIDIKQRAQLERTQRHFVFEPPLKTLLQFFEIQIFTSLVQQTVNESYLATLGSRITTLESATQNVQDQASQLKQHQQRLLKSINNKKQINQLAGLSLW